MVYGTYNYSYWGESKPTYNWGASHCMDFMGLNGHEMGYEWNIGRISWDLPFGNLLSNGFCGSDSELGASYSLQKKWEPRSYE